MSPSIDMNAARSGNQQIFNFLSNLLTHFNEIAKEFTLIAQTHKKYLKNCK